MPKLREAHLQHAYYYLARTRLAHGLCRQGREAFKHGLLKYDDEWTNVQGGFIWAAANAKEDDEAAKLTSDFSLGLVYYLDLRLGAKERAQFEEVALASARRLNLHGNVGAHLIGLGHDYVPTNSK